MPAENRKNIIDDNSLFLLLALVLGRTITIRRITNLYPNKTLFEIFEELEMLTSENIKFEFFCSQPISKDLNIVERIDENKNKLDEAIEQLNSNLSFQHFSNAELRLLEEVLGCEISMDEENVEELKIKIDEYFLKSMAARRVYHYKAERHGAIYKRLKEQVLAGMYQPYKINLSKITSLIENYETSKTKYAFFHYFKELENKKQISIEELRFDEDEPLIIFRAKRKELDAEYKNVPIGNILAPFAPYSLYINGLYSSVDNKFVRLEPKIVKIFNYCFSAKKQEFSYDELRSALGFEDEEKDVTKCISKANVGFRELVFADEKDKHKDKQLFKNSQSEQKYIMEIFTK